MRCRRPRILNKEWRALPCSERVHKIASSWENTKYMPLQSRKGGGVDCIRFVCGVADELYGYSRGPAITLPPDQSLHDREGAIAAMKALCRRYEPLADVTSDPFIEPGDIIVVGPVGGGPGHAMIVGGYRGHVWECLQEQGVQRSGMPAFGDILELFRIYRVLDKHKWL